MTLIDLRLVACRVSRVQRSRASFASPRLRAQAKTDAEPIARRARVCSRDRTRRRERGGVKRTSWGRSQPRWSPCSRRQPGHPWPWCPVSRDASGKAWGVSFRFRDTLAILRDGTVANLVRRASIRRSRHPPPETGRHGAHADRITTLAIGYRAAAPQPGSSRARRARFRRASRVENRVARVG